MEMSRVKDGNYYVVQSFMVKELKLKGLELNLYAIIYGFSQADNQRFTGSLQYLCDWTCSSKQAVINALKKLVDKQLLVKYDKVVNNVKFVEYEAVFNTHSQETLTGEVKKVDGGSQETLPPVQETLMEGSQETLPNKISYKKENNIKDNIPNKLINDKTRVAPNIFTNYLIRSNYINEEDLDIENYNRFMEDVANKHGYAIARACLLHFNNNFTGNDENGNPIADKFNYFTTSVMNGIRKLKTEYDPNNLSEGLKHYIQGAVS